MGSLKSALPGWPRSLGPQEQKEMERLAALPLPLGLKEKREPREKRFLPGVPGADHWLAFLDTTGPEGKGSCTLQWRAATLDSTIRNNEKFTTRSKSQQKKTSQNKQCTCSKRQMIGQTENHTCPKASQGRHKRLSNYSRWVPVKMWISGLEDQKEKASSSTEQT